MLCFAAHLFYSIFQASGLREREREREKERNGKYISEIQNEKRKKTEFIKSETENQCLYIYILCKYF